MLTTLIGSSLDQIDTPALLVDIDTMQANMALMAAALAERGIGWRPHAKAHKSPAIANLELDAGAFGITCAKVSEAEVFARAGVRDILIANQVVGPIKTRRFANLARLADVICAVDSMDGARQLDAAAAEAGTTPRVVIEIDSGMGRAGTQPGAPTVELAQAIGELRHLRFAGLMAWEGHACAINEADPRATAIRTAVGQLVDTAEAVRAAGMPVDIVSCGGTGTFLNVLDIEGVTEVQAGGGIFGDGFYRALDVPVQPALSLMVTVTSRPAPDRIIVDAGRKSVDPSNRPPEAPSLPNVAAMAFSAEHGTIHLTGPCETPRVGDRLRLHIGYSDQAVHLHEQLIAARDECVVAIWPTETRGKLQ
ncbi:MAG TPA: alanine racemase [Thermomicrobiales bacterium]|nr:alanine racemase [Thermomicrobiales bacterium]